MRCESCNQVTGGKTFGGERDKFIDLLTKSWKEGMRAALIDPTMTRSNCRDRCPINSITEPAQWFSWVGGAYHGMCWRHEKPDEVSKWNMENNDVQG